MFGRKRRLVVQRNDLSTRSAKRNCNGDEKDKIDWSTAYIQPKLDGMRCLAHIKANGQVTLVSRDGKVIQNMDHIIRELSTIKQDIILDGELYAHGLSFQENMKLIKKARLETELVKEKNKGGRPPLNKPVETVTDNA